jgi:hypothetical protein
VAEFNPSAESEFTPQAIRVPGCIPTELRQAFEPLKQLIQRVIAGDTITFNVSHISGQNIIDIHNAALLTGELAAVVILSFIRIGNLDGDLLHDGDATLNSLAGGDVTVNGYFVPSGKYAPSGSRCGAVKFEGSWYAIVIGQCTEVLS